MDKIIYKNKPVLDDGYSFKGYILRYGFLGIRRWEKIFHNKKVKENSNDKRI